MVRRNEPSCPPRLTEVWPLGSTSSSSSMSRISTSDCLYMHVSSKSVRLRRVWFRSSDHPYHVYTQYCMPNGKELRNKYNKCNHELTKYRLQNKNIWVECFQKTVWMWPIVLICSSEKWFKNNILYISNRVGDPDLSGPDPKNKKYSDFSNFSCRKPWRNTVIWRRKKLSWKGLRIMYTNIPLRI